MSQANQKTMQRFIDEIINNRDLGVIDEIIHPDYVYRAPGQELHGRQALNELLSAYQLAFPDLHVAIEKLFGTDNHAIVFITLTGTHENDLMGVPATGKQVNINGAICSRFENEQVIEEWELLDQLTMFQQLDLVTI